MLCRGSKSVSDEFYKKLRARFDCKDPEFLDVETSITFTGVDLTMEKKDGETYYIMSQEKEMREFIRSKGLENEKIRSCPHAQCLTERC